MRYLSINGNRLWDTLEVSGRIGKFRETGLQRLALSDEDKAMRDQFVKWCEDAGCSIDIDELGNIFARREGTDSNALPVAIGSHLDTQMCGGKYDGILGVLCGLEVIRVLNDNNIQTKRPIEACVWTNEEGSRFTPPMSASYAYAGLLDVDYVKNSRDLQGKKFGEELARIGYQGTTTVGAHKFDSYFELHIEQGPILDDANEDIAIVVGGYKSYGMRIEFRGETAHVGPTAMSKRKNPLVAACILGEKINEIGWEVAADDGKSTVSCVENWPNLNGTIPEVTQLIIDFRHPNAEIVEVMKTKVEAAIDDAARKSNVEAKVIEIWSFVPNFDVDIIQHLHDTAKAISLKVSEIHSQAGHDAYGISYVAPSGMIFTPCIDGITHNVNERINLDHTIPGANLLLNAVVAYADR